MMHTSLQQLKKTWIKFSYISITSSHRLPLNHVSWTCTTMIWKHKNMIEKIFSSIAADSYVNTRKTASKKASLRIQLTNLIEDKIPRFHLHWYVYLHMICEVQCTNIKLQQRYFKRNWHSYNKITKNKHHYCTFSNILSNKNSQHKICVTSLKHNNQFLCVRTEALWCIQFSTHLGKKLKVENYTQHRDRQLLEFIPFDFF